MRLVIIFLCVQATAATSSDAVNNLASLGNEIESVQCRCSDRHPANDCYVCYSADGSFFEENCCEDIGGVQKCITDQPFAYNDLVVACRAEDEELQLCKERGNTEGIMCKCNTDYGDGDGIIDCFGQDGCLFDRHFCERDHEVCTGEELLPFGEWFRGCHLISREEDYTVCEERSDPVDVQCRCRGINNSFDCFKNEDGCLFERSACPIGHECSGGDAYFAYENITEMCTHGFTPTIEERSSPPLLLEEEDAFFYCIRPGSVSCNVTKFDSSLSSHDVTFGIFAAPYSEHYGPFYSKALKHSLTLGENFNADFTESTYGVALTLTKPTGEEYQIFSDSYLNQFKAGLVVEYENDLSTRFIFNDIHDLVRVGQDDNLVELQCTGFRPLVLFDRADMNHDGVDSCYRDFAIVTEFRSQVWPPYTSKTESQLKMQAIFSFVSGSLSMIGSSLILLIFLRRWSKIRFSTIRERILVGMSAIDLISSTSLMLGPIPSPAGEMQTPWMFGNTATCSAQGWGVQMGFGVPLYNASLCIYFLMVLVFHRDPSTGINRLVEAAMHALPLGFALSTSTAGAALHLYNTNGRMCWIEAAPYDCKWNQIIDCARGSTGKAFLWGFGAAPVMISFVCITISMLWISGSVAWQQRQSKAKNISDYTNSLSSSGNPQVTDYQSSTFSLGTSQQRRSSNGPTQTTRKNDMSIYIQASLYVGAFFLTYIWVFLHYIAQWTTLDIKFWVQAANRIFWPLQGFWNFFIVIRPTYARIRQQDRGRWFWQVLFKSLALIMSGSDAVHVSKNRAKRNSLLLKALQNQSTSGVPSRDFVLSEISEAKDIPDVRSCSVGSNKSSRDLVLSELSEAKEIPEGSTCSIGSNKSGGGRESKLDAHENSEIEISFVPDDGEDSTINEGSLRALEDKM